MANILNKSQKEFFNENGYLFPIKIMTEQKALLYRKNLEQFELLSKLLRGN